MAVAATPASIVGPLLHHSPYRSPSACLLSARATTKSTSGGRASGGSAEGRSSSGVLTDPSSRVGVDGFGADGFDRDDRAPRHHEHLDPRLLVVDAARVDARQGVVGRGHAADVPERLAVHPAREDFVDRLAADGLHAAPVTRSPRTGAAPAARARSAGPSSTGDPRRRRWRHPGPPGPARAARGYHPGSSPCTGTRSP